MSSSKDFTSVWIVDSLRTPIGSHLKGLRNLSSVKLATVVIKGFLKRNSQLHDIVDQVIVGNTVSSGVGQNLARQAAVLSGLSVEVPAFTINQVCSSGLQSMILGAQAIMSGQQQCVLALGAESSSNCPFFDFAKRDPRHPLASQLVDSLFYDGLRCDMTGRSMGELAELIGQKFDISRESQDRFAFNSHLKAIAAQDAGKFYEEIVEVFLQEDNGFVTLKKDERPRRNIRIEKLSELPSAFLKEGRISAGNSSAPSDGAAGVVLVSDQLLSQHSIKPKARVVGFTTACGKPQETFLMGIKAVEQCLKKCEWKKEDVDFFEIGEAFAVQTIITQQELNIPDHKLNVWGGDIGLGHPLGAAGLRILVTLISVLKDRRKKRGIACICWGCGGATAVAIELIE